MKLIAGFALMTFGLVANAQFVQVPLDIYSTMRTERSLSDSAYAVHPEIKPYSIWDVQKFNGMFKAVEAMKSEKSKSRLNPKDTFLFYPVVKASSGFESGSNGGRFLESYMGAGAALLIRNKFNAQSNIIAGYNEPVSYMQKITDTLFVVPGYSHAHKQGGFGYHQLTINAAYRPNDIIEISAGRGKHFIGEGYRSLFLSDYAPNYNYLRADVNAWRIRYIVLYTQMRASVNYPNRFYPVKNKYATMHYLSLNITKWWSVGAFEAVVWESQDSVNHRQVDINYLNPIIFLRPVEFSLGSADNSLMGVSTSIRPLKSFTIYGQFTIDELIVKNALAPVFQRVYPDSAIQTGWFGNKHALQLGLKYHEPIGWKNSTVLIEFNVARPYIYGHANPYQSYTHMNQPLAHPLGANFIEWVGMVMWQPKHRWHTSMQVTYSRKGYTNNLYNMGENPAISNIDIVQSNKVFGYTTTQGKRVDVANARIEVGYTLVENWNLRLESAIHYRWQRSNSNIRDMAFFSLGIRTGLWNDYKNL